MFGKASAGAQYDDPVKKWSDDPDVLHCSFCGKSQKQTKKLIAGPGVYICDECIDLCNEIIAEELFGRPVRVTLDLPHQLVVGTLYARLRAWAEEAPARGLPGLAADLFVGPGEFRPDLWWVREERRPAPDTEVLDVLPDLVVEVTSPGTWREDRGSKLSAYETVGVPELWLVDTESRKVLVFRRSSPRAPEFDVTAELSGDDVLASPLLAGFAVPIAGLFPA